MDSRAFDIEGFLRDADRCYRELHGDEVVRFFEEALLRARACGSADAVIVVANEFGSVARTRGELGRARELYREALSLLERRPGEVPARSRASLLLNYGDVCVAQGSFAEAVELFDAAEALLADEPECFYERSAICNNRSSAWRGLGRMADARRDLECAVDLLERVPGSAGARAVARVNLAQLLIDEGRLDAAERVLAPALEAFLTLSGGRDIHRPNAFAAAGQLRMLQGRYAEAAVCYREAARSLADKVGASENVERLRAAGSRAARLAGWEAGAS